MRMNRLALAIGAALVVMIAEAMGGDDAAHA